MGGKVNFLANTPKHITIRRTKYAQDVTDVVALTGHDMT